MKWRVFVRYSAILINGLFALFLIGTGGWFLPFGLGLPMIVPPTLAIVALLTTPANERGLTR